MNKKEAVERFEAEELPHIIAQEKAWQGGEWSHIDGPHRRETWNNWTDSLCKGGEITAHQYETWTQPRCCGS
jgi:hypothetical protein